MNYRSVFSFLGKLLAVSACFYFVPSGIAVAVKEYSLIPYFLLSSLISFAFGFLFMAIGGKQRRVRTKEGLVIVGLAWILISLIGAIPAFLSGYIPSFVDSFFETVSGFTTTGASILTDFDLPKTIHFWRTFTHWLGGMGILVFMLIFIPSQDGSGFQIMKSESPGPQVGKLVSKVRFTAMILYWLYLVFTVLEFLFLFFGGLGWYDSVVLSLSTAGTGGFAPTAESIRGYGSTYVDIVIMAFMFLFSINFSLYYLIIIGKLTTALKDEELHFYLLLLLFAILAVTLDNMVYTAEYGYNFFTSLHYSAFAVITVSSTTGFMLVDFTQWTGFSQFILILMMIVGGMAGSTGGGLKASRALILLKSSKADTMGVFRPNGVYSVKLNQKTLSRDVITGARNYFGIACLLGLISCLVISFDPISDFTTAVTTFLTCFNNVGPGLGTIIGPCGGFAGFTDFSKVFLSVIMLIGRLEIFPILLLFLPKTWSVHF